MSVALDTTAYVGIPWLDRGRTREGCDCWGLLRLVYTEVLGLEVPDYSEGYASAGERATVSSLVAAGTRAWTRLAPGSERAGDAVLLRQAPWHVGVVVRPGLMLHMPEDSLSCCEPYDSGRWGRRVEGIYRLTEDAS